MSMMKYTKQEMVDLLNSIDDSVPLIAADFSDADVNTFNRLVEAIINKEQK